MNTVDTGRMLLFALEHMGRVAADAVGDPLGSSLPLDVETLVTPEFLNRAIDTHGVEPLAGPSSIVGVHREPIASISSNCVGAVLRIEQRDPAVLPSGLFLKFPQPSLATRWFFSLIGSWRLESWFFRHVAPQVPMRTPITYATHCQGTRFYLIQENLHDDPDIHLFTNLDMTAGPSLDVVGRCLDTFARLHACHVHASAAEREAILPLDNHPFLSPHMRRVSPALGEWGPQLCLQKRPGRIPDDVLDAYRRTLRHWDRLLDYWYSGPLSLLHGDSHLGNFFVSGDEMGMLDFQAVHWGKGIRDVQYFLINSLPAQVLADNEDALVRHYVERRAHYGAPIEFDPTWQDYRGFTFHTLMTIVVSIGFGALSAEQDELMGELLERAVAAVERVDYAGWLDDFL